MLTGSHRSVLMSLVNERRDATSAYVSSLLRLETTPFTQNEHYLQTKTAKTLGLYRDARAGKSMPEVASSQNSLKAAPASPGAY